jgi:SOS-response transcriptional repressor LexA
MRVLTLIRDHQRKHGYSPTMQELADVLDVSKVTVFEHVAALERKVSCDVQASGSLFGSLPPEARFPDDSGGSLRLVGHIAAGAPIEAIEIRKPSIWRIFSRPGRHRSCSRSAATA